jgi:hypothetical protein
MDTNPSACRFVSRCGFLPSGTAPLLRPVRGESARGGLRHATPEYASQAARVRRNPLSTGQLSEMR